jgi:hypothetical protein
MKNWLAPIAVLGLSGLGLVCASERGRQQVRAFFDGLARNGDPLSEMNKFFDEQLENIQDTLDRLAEALQAEEEQKV